MDSEESEKRVSAGNEAKKMEKRGLRRDLRKTKKMRKSGESKEYIKNN